MTKPRPAVVLLSGGLDSATVAAIARAEGFAVTGLCVDYGQRHRVELEAAARVAAQLGVEDLRTIRLDLRAIGGSALTDDRLEVPKTGLGDTIPVTYVPARNTVLLSLALGLAETLGAHDLFFGANALDYSGYPDCRPAFVDAFTALANLATADAVEGGARYAVHAPLMHPRHGPRRGLRPDPLLLRSGRGARLRGLRLVPPEGPRLRRGRAAGPHALRGLRPDPGPPPASEGGSGGPPPGFSGARKLRRGAG
jgi:7-cyano-7-deazaguanine synthase